MAPDPDILARVVLALDLLTQRFEVMNASVQRMSESVQQLAELLIEFDEEPDPASQTLDGPIDNHTRDQSEPL